MILAVFILLQAFRLIDLLIVNKTVENIMVIPFQLVIFLLPAYLFAKIKSPQRPTDYFMKLRVKLPSLYQIPLIITGVIALACGCLLISIVFNGAKSSSDGFTLYNTFVSRNGGGFFEALFLIIAYAAVPAFCEELVFRGILSREFERYNVVFGIFSSSLFFALLHFNPSQIPVYLFSGIVLALSMYATGSIAVPMIMHFIYNVFGLFGQSFINAFYEVTGGSVGLFVFIILIIGLLATALFCNFASISYQKRAKFSTIPNHKLLPKADSIVAIFSEIFLTPWSIAAICFYIVVVIIYSLI